MPVALAPVLEGIAGGAADPVSAAVVAELNPEGLRPSIETTLHALLPHRVVVHTHSVRTIALAIRADGEAQLAERLAGLRWAWVPYCKPGPAADPSRRRAAGRGAASTSSSWAITAWSSAPTRVTEADALLREVERRLDGPAERLQSPPQAPRPTPAGAPAHARAAHTLALDPQRLRRACAGSLYPDHVIFLGPAATRSPRAQARQALLAAGRGACSPRTLAPAPTSSPCAWRSCWSGCREAPLHYLTAADEAELLDWDAEKYRPGARALARPTSALTGNRCGTAAF